MIREWKNISYLKKGDSVQRDVYKILLDSRILNILAAFSPVLAGTYPIGIYLPGSDLDIICEYKRPAHFEKVLRESFYHHEAFNFTNKTIRGIESLIARFKVYDYSFEIFGQQQPVEDQFAYRHMLIEHKILLDKGEVFKQKVIALKQKGFSTEEAFAFLLGIEGDPYTELLRLEVQ